MPLQVNSLVLFLPSVSWVLLQFFWLTATSIPSVGTRYLPACGILFFHCSFSRFQPFSVQTWDFFFQRSMDFWWSFKMGKCHLKWEILVVPLHDFPSNLVSLMNPSVTVMLGRVVSFTLTAWEDSSQGWDVTASHCQGTLPGANTSDIFAKGSAQKDQSFRKPVWFTLTHSWIYPEQLMGSVSSLMVQGLVLNAVVDLPPKVP